METGMCKTRSSQKQSIKGVVINHVEVSIQDETPIEKAMANILSAVSENGGFITLRDLERRNGIDKATALEVARRSNGEIVIEKIKTKKAGRPSVIISSCMKKEAIQMVDWGLVDQFTEPVAPTIPENAITRQKIEERYGIKQCQAGRKMRILRDSGKFDVFRYQPSGLGGVSYYLVPKEA